MNKKDAERINGNIEYEGFDYALVEYDSYKGAKDKKFHELLKKYKDARREISLYISSECERNDVPVCDELEVKTVV